MAITDTTFLVLSATGRQGRAVIKALIAKGATSIVASSRNPTSDASQKLLELEQVTKVVQADFNDPESIEAAINASNATHVWFTTDFWSIPFLKRTRAKEAQLGFNVIDAIKKAKVNGIMTLNMLCIRLLGTQIIVLKTFIIFWGKRILKNTWPLNLIQRRILPGL